MKSVQCNTQYSTRLYALQYICICVGCIVSTTTVFNCTPGFHIEEKENVRIICPPPLNPLTSCLLLFDGVSIYCIYNIHALSMNEILKVLY